MTNTTEKSTMLEDVAREIMFEHMYGDQYISLEDAKLLAKGRLVEEGYLNFDVFDEEN